ncbi:MAG: exodeoxyribonuclease VII large subunit, partial [Roseburia sp.]|nr:exodeoxyribonuclease VII large subunit [Roseburia sp.]
MTGNKPFTVTVSQLNRRIALMLKGDKSLAGLVVRGELSNVTLHSSGHLFFTLRDESAAVRGVMFRSNAERLAFLPEEGMSVIVTGNVQCFERDGVYQIYAVEIAPSGAGEQAVAQKQLKERLLKEGIFSRKRPLPTFPQKICVITAETGAAIRDILNVLERRCPTVRVIFIPALVQGDKAPESICRAFRLAEGTDADLVIFGRGGGSAEDLSAFDTEAVARAVYLSPIPTISAVGHEIDVCLADLAADLRAPTPSAAAELAVP